MWSPDSKRVAFLWNDEGTPFLDVWVQDADSGKLMRVTHMPRMPYPADAGMDVGKLEQRAKYESDHGISSVVWEREGRSLLFLFRGELYRVGLFILRDKLYDMQPGDEATRVLELDGITQLTRGSRCTALVVRGNLWGTCGGDADPTFEMYAPGRKDVAVGRVWWSPDDTQMAFEEVDRSAIPTRGIPDYLTPETTLHEVKRAFPGEPAARTRIGIVSVKGGAVRWLPLGDDLQDLVWEVSWSPDGKTLLVDKSDLYIKDRRLMTVDAATGAAKVLVREQNPRNVTAEWWSGWAPDGRGVYFVSDFQPGSTDYQVYFQPLGGGAARAVTAGDWSVSAVQQAGGALCLGREQGPAGGAAGVPRGRRGRTAGAGDDLAGNAYAVGVAGRAMAGGCVFERCRAAGPVPRSRGQRTGAAGDALRPAGVCALSTG